MGFPAYYALSGSRPPRTGASHSAIAPYGPFQTGDGRSVLLSVQNDREWRNFCQGVLNKPELTEDSRFMNNARRVENRPALREIVTEVFSKLNRDQVLERLEGASIANAEMRSVVDFWSHPQLKARGQLAEVDSGLGRLPALRPPPIIEGVEPTMGEIPELGQHTDAILAELGYDRAQIDRLRLEKIV